MLIDKTKLEVSKNSRENAIIDAVNKAVFQFFNEDGELAQKGCTAADVDKLEVCIQGTLCDGEVLEISAIAWQNH